MKKMPLLALVGLSVLSMSGAWIAGKNLRWVEFGFFLFIALVSWVGFCTACVMDKLPKIPPSDSGANAEQKKDQ